MPYYANAMYGRGVPTYAQELSPLADVFKAYAPNHLREAQMEGYLSNARLSQAKANAQETQTSGLGGIADAFKNNDIQGGYVEAIRSGNANLLKNMPETARGFYSAGDNVDPNKLADLFVGAGGNYASTKPGFGADQQRLVDAAVQQSSDRRYQTDETVGATLNGQRLLDARTRELDANGLENKLEQARIKSGAKGGGAAALKVDPVKFDQALLQSLPGSYQDAKGKWFVDPSIQPGDLADVRRRAAARLAENPLDQYGGIQGSISDVFGASPQVDPGSPAVTHWWPGGDEPAVPPTVRALPLGQRGGGGQPAALPPAAAPGAQSGANPVVGQAQDAIARGAPREAVIQRLRANGVSDADIQAAGL